MAIIGIDLGTTNSLGSVYSKQGVQLIKNPYGSYFTPSIVAVDDDGQILVGLPAKQYQLEHPERAASLFKRKMGSKEVVKLGNKSFTPEELSSFVIRSIVDDAERYLGEPVSEAIVSVPAYFYDSQRFATKKAGALANVHVERIVNEPSAAALATYITEEREQLSLVFDFGGGTLDVSVIDCLGSVVNILAISGDNQLGGSDFDQAIAMDFLAEHHLSHLSEMEQNALLLACEQCKIRLSEENETDLVFHIDGTRLISRYSRKRLARQSEAILKKIRTVVYKAMNDANVSGADIEQVVMVGGSSKMPLVQSFARYLFQKSIVAKEDCDLRIAQGLGYFCGIKERKEGIKQYILADICPFSLSEETYNKDLPSRSYCSVIIPRNSPLPCSMEKHFYTIRDNQDKIEIVALQGESVYADQNKRLGSFTVPIPKGPKGSQGAAVRYTYDINGILAIDVTVLSTGEKTSRVFCENLSSDALQKQLDKLEKLKIHPRDKQENKELMARLEAMVESSLGYKRDVAMELLQKFTHVLEEQNTYKIEKARKNILSFLTQEETSQVFDAEAFIDQFEQEQDEEESDEPMEWEVFKKWTN